MNSNEQKTDTELQDKVKEFYEALAKDKAMQERAEAVFAKHKDSQPDEDAAWSDLAGFAQAEGFEVTAEELAAYKKEHGRQLTDEELATVAAGTLMDDYCVCIQVGTGITTQKWCGCAYIGYGNGSGFKCFCFFGGGGDD
jgi:hypothetical protein